MTKKYSPVKLAADWTLDIHIRESAAKCEVGSRLDIAHSHLTFNTQTFYNIPIPTPVFNIPNSTAVYNIPLPTPVYKIPLPTLVYNIPLPTLVYNIPLPTPVYNIPLPTHT